jgi:transcription antitermination factor NusG
MQYLEHIRNETAGSWCALYTRHQHEKTVATILSTKGLQVFLPTYRTVHRWKDRNKQLELPLFPSYLFFKYEAHHRIQILSTPGVHMILTAGNAPAVIPNEEIVAIQSAAESSLRMEPHPFLKYGDTVRIKSGPLAGLEGLVSRKKDAFRLVLSVEMLGRSAAVEIDGSVLERVQSQRPGDVLPGVQGLALGHEMNSASIVHRS